MSIPISNSSPTSEQWVAQAEALLGDLKNNVTLVRRISAALRKSYDKGCRDSYHNCGQRDALDMD